MVDGWLDIGAIYNRSSGNQQIVGIVVVVVVVVHNIQYSTIVLDSSCSFWGSFMCVRVFEMVFKLTSKIHRLTNY